MVDREYIEQADRADGIVHMTNALRETFGDQALDVARRQIEQGGEAAAVWRAIAARLASASRD